MAATKKYFTEEEKIEVRRIEQKRYRDKHKIKINKNNKSYYLKNKEKIEEKGKAYRKTNEEKIKKYRTENKNKTKKYNKEYSKKYRDNNKEKLKNHEKEYRNTHKEKIKEYHKKYKTERSKTDPLFRLTQTIRTRIGDSLRRKNFTKKSRTYEILGCSFEQFKTYIESKFESWMTWDNYGKYNGQLNYGWDFDHIIPLITAVAENEIIKLNHYTNFQPLCSKTNRDVKKHKLSFIV